MLSTTEAGPALITVLTLLPLPPGEIPRMCGSDMALRRGCEGEDDTDGVGLRDVVRGNGSVILFREGDLLGDEVVLPAVMWCVLVVVVVG